MILGAHAAVVSFGDRAHNHQAEAKASGLRREK
jgi:hypothetical protein